jgi:hypothetical protein
MIVPAPELQPDDFFRTYNLPDTVEAMIPTSAQPGEPGSHWVARGLLSETCAQLLGRPVHLDYVEKEKVLFISADVSLASTVVSADPLGTTVAVGLIIARTTGHWALFYNDRMLVSGNQLPSPTYLAGVVSAAYDAGRSPLPTCREMPERPKYLW